MQFQPSTRTQQIRFNPKKKTARRNAWSTPWVLKYYEDRYVDDLEPNEYDAYESAIQKGVDRGLKDFITQLDKAYKRDSPRYSNIMSELYARHSSLMSSQQQATYKNNYSDPSKQISVLVDVLIPTKEAFYAKFPDNVRVPIESVLTADESGLYGFMIDTLKFVDADALLTSVQSRLQSEADAQNRSTIRSRITQGLQQGGAVNIVTAARDSARTANAELEEAKKDLQKARKEISDLKEQLDSITTESTGLKEQISLLETTTPKSTYVAVFLGIGVVALGGYLLYTQSSPKKKAAK